MFASNVFAFASYCRALSGIYCAPFAVQMIAFKRLTSSFSSSRSFFTRLNNASRRAYSRSTRILRCSSSFHPCHIVHMFDLYIDYSCALPDNDYVIYAIRLNFYLINVNK